MKKTLVAVTALLALLALPVLASGDSARGTQDNYKISLTLKLSEDRVPQAIKRFRFRKLDVTCEGDAVTEVGGRIAHMRINERNRFNKTLRRPANRVRVRGKVTDNLKRIRGVIRARGDFGPALQDCDSGPVRWRARVG